MTDTPNGDVGDPNAPASPPPPPPSSPSTASGSVPPPPPMQPQAEAGKWFEAIGIVILSLVCCWPLGLVLLWTNKKFTQKTKLIVTGVIVGILLIGGIAGLASGGSSSSSGSGSTPKVTTETTAEANTATTEGSGKTTTTKAPTTTAAPKNSAKITKDEFNQIQDGMTRAQVAEIVGSPGEVLSESTIAGYTTVMVSWDGSSFASSANAMFQNDKLISKAQFGL